jgi:hypothetical protein
MYVRGAFFAHKWIEPSLNKGFQISLKIVYTLIDPLHQCNLLNMSLFWNIEASRSFNFSFFVTKLVLRGSVLGYHLSMGPRITNLILFFLTCQNVERLYLETFAESSSSHKKWIICSPRVPIPLQIQKITIDLNCPWQSLAWGYLVGQIRLTHPFPHPCCIWCSTSRKLSLFIDCYSNSTAVTQCNCYKSPMNMTWRRSLGLLKAKLASSKTMETEGKKIVVQEKTWTCNLVQ